VLRGPADGNGCAEEVAEKGWKVAAADEVDVV